MQEPWYKNGLRFTCTNCGKCCRTHGEYAWVYLTAEDIKRLTAHFSLPSRQFLFRYTDRDDVFRVLKWENDQCVFLSENGCTVYEARPTQCRTWPFWPENLEQAVWEADVESFCPGTGRGRLYSREEIDLLALSSGETES